jgi:hypothetical protein
MQLLRNVFAGIAMCATACATGQGGGDSNDSKADSSDDSCQIWAFCDETLAEDKITFQDDVILVEGEVHEKRIGKPEELHGFRLPSEDDVTVDIALFPPSGSETFDAAMMVFRASKDGAIGELIDFDFHSGPEGYPLVVFVPDLDQEYVVLVTSASGQEVGDYGVFAAEHQLSGIPKRP